MGICFCDRRIFIRQNALNVLRLTKVKCLVDDFRKVCVHGLGKDSGGKGTCSSVIFLLI